MKKLVSLLLIVCICFSIVGCNKATDTNSSSLSSTITEIETETVIVEQESSANDTTTEESKVETTTSNTTSENNTPSQNTPTSSTTTPSQESTPSSNETPTTSKDPNAPLTDEELKEFMPDWFFEYPAREIVDICELGRENKDEKRYFVITTQNELYELSPDKLFSNGTHFKKVESDLKFVRFALCEYIPGYSAFISGVGIIMLTSNGYYCIDYGNDSPTSSHCLHGDLCPINNVFAPLSNANKIDMREVSGKNSVAQIKYESNNILSLDNDILYSFPQDETIISAVTHVVQTTKGYYYIHAKTEQEFADSEPVTTYSAEFIGTKPEDRFIKYFRENS